MKFKKRVNITKPIIVVNGGTFEINYTISINDPTCNAIEIKEIWIHGEAINIESHKIETLKATVHIIKGTNHV